MYNNESNSRVEITSTKTRCNIVFVQNYWLLVGTVITPIMQNVKNQSFTIRLFPNPKSISYYVLICEHNTKLNRWVGHWSHLSNAPLLWRMEEELKFSKAEQSSLQILQADDNWMLSINLMAQWADGRLDKIICQFFFSKLYFSTLAKSPYILALVLLLYFSFIRKNSAKQFVDTLWKCYQK